AAGDVGGGCGMARRDEARVLPGEGGGPHRLLDGVRPKGLDDAVDAFPAGQLAHCLAPSGRSGVVQDVVGAERAELVKLGVAGGERDDTAAEELGELKGEE